MADWEGKTKGGRSGYQFFIFLLKYPGLKFSYLFLRFVVLYYVLFAPKVRNPIFWYFRNIQHFSIVKSIRYLFKNFYALGQVLLDKVALLGGFSDKFTFDFDGEEYLHEMATGKGGIIMGAHVGNWEMAGQMLERIDCTVHIVMLEAEHENIKRLLDETMVKKRLNIIAIKDDYSHLFAISEALINNDIVAVHGDRFIEGTKTIEQDFMGRKAKFPYGPFYLSVKYQKPVSFVSAVKETDTHYHFYATKPKIYQTTRSLKLKHQQVEQVVNDYLKEVEHIVKMHPEQWFNYYYFWAL